MIRQYLSNTNENATVPVLQNFLELNKAQMNIPESYFGVYETRGRKHVAIMQRSIPLTVLL